MLATIITIPIYACMLLWLPMVSASPALQKAKSRVTIKYNLFSFLSGASSRISSASEKFTVNAKIACSEYIVSTIPKNIEIKSLIKCKSVFRIIV